ncbi:MAG: Holliday junction resolvase RuvX [Clostridiales bacterium]
MRILGIDFGESRIGISMSDPLGMIAQGCDTIEWKGAELIPYDKILEKVKINNVSKIVVGLPKNMNGSMGPRADRTLVFIEGLKKIILEEKLEVDIIKWDERLSTKAAYRTMHEIGLKAKKKKGIVDKLASVHILQNYLDSIA